MRPRDRIVLRVLRSLDEIDAIAVSWQALEADCPDPLGYFQSYDWCRNWVRQFGGSMGRPYVVTIWREDELVAVWPRMVVEAAGIRRLETLGAPHSQYCGIIVRRDSVPLGDLAPLLREATRASGCDVALCRAVPAGTALAEIIAEKPTVPGSENAASMLDLSGFGSAADYTAALGKLQKRNRNRRRNHLARLGELDFRVIWPDDPDFAPLVRTCTQMKRRWLVETGRYSVGFSAQGYEDFMAALPGDAGQMEGACLSVLRAGDRVVALELGFVRQRHYYAYVGGFDWDLRDLSPGKVQMDMTVCWLIDHGVEAYDLLINPADYKASWTNRTIAVTTRAQALTWKGRLYSQAWLRSLRPALKRLHGRLPVLLDRLTAFMRPAACLLLYV